MFRNVTEILLKTSGDVRQIRKSCEIAENVLHYLKQFIKPGISTGELNTIAIGYLSQWKAESALLGYQGFPAAICTSVNSAAAHGLPSARALVRGDILTIDITVVLNGWYGDAAWTFLVGECDQKTRQLLRAAWQINLAGILAVRAGRKIGDIGYYIGKTARKFGCRVLDDFAGHGIGKKMHEDPLIPHLGKKGLGMRIIPGMVFTIEPIVTFGKPLTRISEDGWTIVTTDNSPTAQFEHTIAVFKDRIEILTFSQKINQKSIDYPPYF